MCLVPLANPFVFSRRLRNNLSLRYMPLMPLYFREIGRLFRASIRLSKVVYPPGLGRFVRRARLVAAPSSHGFHYTRRVKRFAMAGAPLGVLGSIATIHYGWRRVSVKRMTPWSTPGFAGAEFPLDMCRYKYSKRTAWLRR